MTVPEPVRFVQTTPGGPAEEPEGEAIEEEAVVGGPAGRKWQGSSAGGESAKPSQGGYTAMIFGRLGSRQK